MDEIKQIKNHKSMILLVLTDALGLIAGFLIGIGIGNLAVGFAQAFWAPISSDSFLGFITGAQQPTYLTDSLVGSFVHVPVCTFFAVVMAIAFLIANTVISGLDLSERAWVILTLAYVLAGAGIVLAIAGIVLIQTCGLSPSIGLFTSLIIE